MNLLVSWLIEGIGLALVATVVARFIPAGSPAQRHAFWWLALAGMLALPFLPGVLVSDRPAFGAPSTAVGSIPSALTVPAPPAWLPVAAFGTWVALALVSLTRLLLNLQAVQHFAAGRPARCLRSASTASPSSRRRAPARVQRASTCRTTSAAPARSASSSPGSCSRGDLVAALDDDAIEAIVLHEYAHLQRYDDWTRLLQQFVLGFAGVHPGVRWASRQIDIEREAACDRLVVARTGATGVLRAVARGRG